MKYAQITIAISDQCDGGLEGFAQVSDDPLPESVFAEAVEDGQGMNASGKTYSVFLDLMDESGQVGEKCISIDHAGRILGADPATLVPLGRQRLAQINDEYSEYLARRGAL